MNKIKVREPAYVKRRRELMESPAWGALTLAAIRVLERLEIELMKHAGKNNGRLIVTYDQFVEYGVRRMSIASAIKLLVDVGLLEVPRKGWRSAGRDRRPAMYRITYYAANGEPASDEWKSYRPSVASIANYTIFPSSENATVSGSENATGPGSENATGRGIRIQSLQ